MERCKQHLVSGIFIKDKCVLLGLRKNTKDFSGFWSVPVGHVEQNEAELDALKRELSEELGIFALSVDKQIAKEDKALDIINSFYLVKQWSGEIENKEPELCERLEWFPIGDLPKRLTPVCKQVLNELNGKIV